ATHPGEMTAAVILSASYGGVTRTANLEVRGGPPKLAQLLIQPASIVAGQTLHGMVVLDGAAPAGGFVVALASSSRIAAVPPRVTVSAGLRFAFFDIQTFPVRKDTPVRIIAVAGRVAKTADLQVLQPPLAGLTLSTPLVTG